MENEPEVIRDQMQETRTALSEKLEALETQVSSTVQSATAAVTDTVQAVKDSVSETVDSVKGSVQETVSSVKDSVKGAFDLPAHVENHPWLAVLGSVAVGFIGGKVLNGLGGAGQAARDLPREYRSFSEALPAKAKETNGHGASSGEAPHKEEPGLLGGLTKAFGAEFDTLKGLGVSAVAGVVRDLVTQSVGGEIGSRLREWMDEMTKQMGAKPLAEPVLQQEESAASREEPKRGQAVNVRRETLPRN